VFTGSGDQVVDVEKWDGPALVRITHSGGGNFAVWNYGPNNERIDLLVNTIGSYAGTLPLDWLDNEDTVRFQVTAGGTWEIHIDPFETMRRENVPGRVDGVGDDVVLLDGTPDVISVEADKASGNFAIWAWGTDGRDLIVNEIAPYTGKVLAPGGTRILVITAEKEWTLAITGR
jgi:hypothetical protein